MRKAFSLLELMAAVLIASMISLMIAGGLRGAIKSWEAVQKRVSQNYNRRSVLGLLKRQSTSLFFERNAQEVTNQSSPRTIRDRREERERKANQAETLDPQGQLPPDGTNDEGGIVEFALPDGAHYFMGNVQELNFISTVSFLSDFPGQVAVRYYVVQGQPGEDETLADLTTSRTDNDIVDDGEELEMAEAMVGDIYLVLEERNLFLSSAADENDEDSEDSGDMPFMGNDNMLFNAEGSMSEVSSTNTMKLIGPLREFMIRYRIPGITRAEDLPDEERWSDVWDLNEDGNYPSAIEFTMYFEDPGVTDDVNTEDLERIRMVIPVYDARNLTRGGGGRGNASFPN